MEQSDLRDLVEEAFAGSCSSWEDLEGLSPRAPLATEESDSEGVQSTQDVGRGGKDKNLMEPEVQVVSGSAPERDPPVTVRTKVNVSVRVQGTPRKESRSSQTHGDDVIGEDKAVQTPGPTLARLWRERAIHERLQQHPLSLSGTSVISVNGDVARGAEVGGEEWQAVRVGLAGTLAMLTYRDRLLPLQCPSCNGFLPPPPPPQSISGFRASCDANVAVQRASDSMGTLYSIPEHGEHDLYQSHPQQKDIDNTITTIPEENEEEEEQDNDEKWHQQDKQTQTGVEEYTEDTSLLDKETQTCNIEPEIITENISLPEDTVEEEIFTPLCSNKCNAETMTEDAVSTAETTTEDVISEEEVLVTAISEAVEDGRCENDETKASVLMLKALSEETLCVSAGEVPDDAENVSVSSSSTETVALNSCNTKSVFSKSFSAKAVNSGGSCELSGAISAESVFKEGVLEAVVDTSSEKTVSLCAGVKVENSEEVSSSKGEKCESASPDVDNCDVTDKEDEKMCGTERLHEVMNERSPPPVPTQKFITAKSTIEVQLHVDRPSEKQVVVVGEEESTGTGSISATEEGCNSKTAPWGEGDIHGAGSGAGVVATPSAAALSTRDTQHRFCDGSDTGSATERNDIETFSSEQRGDRTGRDNDQNNGTSDLFTQSIHNTVGHEEQRALDNRWWSRGEQEDPGDAVRCIADMRQKNKNSGTASSNDNEAAAGSDVVVVTNGAESAGGEGGDCNGHVINNHHHHHHSTARSILKSVLKRTGSSGHHKNKAGKGGGGTAVVVPAPPPPPQQLPPPQQPPPPTKKKHRVQFDESKNKFFDADYVILIREEEEEEEEEDDEEEEEDDEDDERDLEEQQQQQQQQPQHEMCTCGVVRPAGAVRTPLVGMPLPRRLPPGGAVKVLPQHPGAASGRGSGFDLNIPEQCTFEPPLEFIDQVTLSPPEGYKDVVNRGLQQAANNGAPIGCKAEQNAALDEELATSPGQTQELALLDSQNPATQGGVVDGPTQRLQPQQRYIVETITMTTVTERRIVREADPRRPRSPPPSASDKLSGILKGGKLWKTDSPQSSLSEQDDPPNDDRRFVRFQNQENASSQTTEQEMMDEERPQEVPAEEMSKEDAAGEDESSPDCTELTLTFKLGHHQHHVLVANNVQQQQPKSTGSGNSAVRQLFPEEQGDNKLLAVTAESLRLFEEAKRSKLAQYQGVEGNTNVPPLVTSDVEEADGSRTIRRTIERNALRRSLLRYEPKARLRGGCKKDEDSLEERIRRLTCDLDDEDETDTDQQSQQQNEGSEMIMPPRTSPQGEESQQDIAVQTVDKATSPDMSPSQPPTTTTTATATVSTYKKLTDLFARRSNAHPPTNSGEWAEHHHHAVPLDLGNGMPTTATSPGDHKNFVGPKCAVSRASVTSEARKQFLSTLAPLAACVTSGATHDEGGEGGGNEYYYHPQQPQQQQVVVTSPLSVSVPGERLSMASSAQGDEYSLDDIDEALSNDAGGGGPQPDVVAGTPGGGTETTSEHAPQPPGTPVDELALFVQQDAGRIERIKKRYNTSDDNNNDDDEHDDYGFNRRPSVRGIKPRFGSTTEILQQMQSQLQPPALLACPARSHVTWPYGVAPQEGSEMSGSPTADTLPRRRVPLGSRGPEDLGSPYGNYSPTGSVILQAVSPTDRKTATTERRYVYPYQQQLSPSQQIMRIGGGCAEYQPPPPPPGNIQGAPRQPLQHLQYSATGSPPPPPPPQAVPRGYSTLPGDVITSLVPADGAPAQYQHGHQYPAGFQSLDRNSGNMMYGRRMTAPAGVVQMRISPVSATTSPMGLHHHHHHQPPPGGVVKLSAAPFPNDPSLTAIIEPHYSVMPPHPQAPSSTSRSSPITTTSVIRVGHGQQQTIRVPYPSGTPVQVHLLTRSGAGSESPQRGSPLMAPRHPVPPHPQQYVVARGTQTPNLSGSTSSLYPVPPNARYYPPQVNGVYTGGRIQYIPEQGPPGPAMSTSPQQPAYPGRVAMQYQQDTMPSPTPQQQSALSPNSAQPTKGPVPYSPENMERSQPQSIPVNRPVFPDMKNNPQLSTSPQQSAYNMGKIVTSPLPSSATVATAVPYTGGGGSPTRTVTATGERGVPEGAASCSPNFPQDAIYSQGQPTMPTVSNNNEVVSSGGGGGNISESNPAGTTSVYYSMNV